MRNAATDAASDFAPPPLPGRDVAGEVASAFAFHPFAPDGGPMPGP